MKYNTKQRELILNCLKTNAGEHMSVEELSHLIRNSGSAVGISTVYRYLDKLTEQGVVRKYSIPESKRSCYSYVGESGECREHFHLQCSSCGKLIHLDCDYIDELEKHIMSHHGFKVDNTRTVFYGRCSDCEKSNSNSDSASCADASACGLCK